MEDNEKYGRKVQERHVIKCPHCGWEYLPSEVLYPDQVIGKPNYNSIIKDPLGHILYEEYSEENEPLAEDTFICEHCGKPFIVEIETKFKTRVQEEELDFSSKEVSLW